MHFYKFGYTSPAESPFILLIHQNRFSKEEFGQMCAECLHKAGYENKAVMDIWEKALELLIKEYGFKRIKPVAEFMPFGWGDPNCSTNNRSHWTDRENEFNHILNEF